MPKYALNRHHPIKVWGIVNIYMPLTAPNGTIFTLCQCIMAIKSIVNLSSPLFLSVYTTEEGEVIITCDKSLKDEGETMISHFGIYLKLIVGAVVWTTFTKAYRLSMKDFQYYPLKKYAIEKTAEADTLAISPIAINNSAVDISQYFF